MTSPLAHLQGVSLRYGQTVALDGIDLRLPAGRMIGLIGPDGVGKSSLLALLSGARTIQHGRIEALGGDMADAAHRRQVCPRIAYMPQGLGRNLYPTLSVEENLQFFARLFGHDQAERRRRIDTLTTRTGLFPFLKRPAGKLSGGMKQKLGLCCALVHDPDLLILDEPTTGVDPLARSQFWDLIAQIRAERPQMSVIVATAYMDEAQRFDWLVAMDAGRILAEGPPADLLARTASPDLESAFIALLPPERRSGHTAVQIPPLPEAEGDPQIAIEARGLTMRFGDFVAVNQVSFRIRRGEIFGFLGSNGCGKSTTMKMLTGLLPATEGQAWLFGEPVSSGDIDTRRRVGYMSQAFSLYTELTVHQNLVLHARLFQVPEADIPARVADMVQRFSLAPVLDTLPESLPMGVRQRLSLAVAMVHKPELLILDEPTSGVDPIARDNFWRLLITLSREDQVTIFISTHFMNEAQRCDRVSLMHAGQVLVSDAPDQIVRDSGQPTLEAAFIGHLVAAAKGDNPGTSAPTSVAQPSVGTSGAEDTHAAGPQPLTAPARFSLGRLLCYLWRETLELRRDPMRGTLALLGSVILMFIFGYGINLDVENLKFAVLDRDQTQLSQGYALNLAGSRYFIEAPPLQDTSDLDRRLRAGQIALAIEIPPGFAQRLEAGRPVEIAAWVDGAMPTRGETVLGYVQGMHLGWLSEQATHRLGVQSVPLAKVETRFRYNPDVRSLPAMVPAVIPMLLLMLPAMLAALSVVREKEMGSITNLYVTPVTRLEFLLGKQLPYVALAMVNFFLMALLAVTVFGVPVRGSFAALTLSTLVYVTVATGIGLLASTFTRSQIAAMFTTMIGTIMPTVQFSGMLDPTSSLEGAARFIGKVYPAAHMLTISRGVFNKGLGMAELQPFLWPLLATVPVLLGASLLLLRKQET